MDLLAARQANDKLQARIKAGAFMCFVIAGVLLVASLLLSPPAQPGSGEPAPPGAVATVR